MADKCTMQVMNDNTWWHTISIQAFIMGSPHNIQPNSHESTEISMLISFN